MGLFITSFLRIFFKNISYTPEEFLEFSKQALERNGIEKWERDIFDFVIEWFNDKNFFIAFTSGSTGDPKAIQISKAYARASAERTAAFFDFQNMKNVLLCLPVSFIAGKMMLVRAFHSDLDLYIEKAESNPMINLNQKIDFAAMTPHQLHNAIDSSSEKVASISKILLGGGPLGKNLEREIQSFKNDIYIGYGMTETVTHIAIRKVNGDNASDYFTCMDGVHINQDDEKRLIINANHLGISGLGTQDIVEINQSGNFRWLGRADRIINSGGVKFNPEQIENKLSEKIKEPFFVFGLKDEILGEKLIIVIESSDETYKIDELKKEMPHLKTIFYTSKFQRTHTGKVDRKKTVTTLISE